MRLLSYLPFNLIHTDSPSVFDFSKHSSAPSLATDLDSWTVKMRAAAIARSDAKEEGGAQVNDSKLTTLSAGSLRASLEAAN